MCGSKLLNFRFFPRGGISMKKEYFRLHIYSRYYTNPKNARLGKINILIPHIRQSKKLLHKILILFTIICSFPGRFIVNLTLKIN